MQKLWSTTAPPQATALAGPAKMYFNDFKAFRPARFAMSTQVHCWAYLPLPVKSPQPKPTRYARMFRVRTAFRRTIHEVGERGIYRGLRYMAGKILRRRKNLGTAFDVG